MGEVLSIKAKFFPVCECGRALPNFGSQQCQAYNAKAEDFTVEAVTFHVRCACSRTWDLKKTVRP